MSRWELPLTGPPSLSACRKQLYLSSGMMWLILVIFAAGENRVLQDIQRTLFQHPWSFLLDILCLQNIPGKCVFFVIGSKNEMNLCVKEYLWGRRSQKLS